MDQWNNNVDGEIRVPIKGWQPLGVNSWIEKPADHEWSMPQRVVLGIDVAHSPLKTETQWALAYADGSISEERYTREDTAKAELEYIRIELKGYGVPEEYWPVLMERDVETVATSWRILSE